MSLHSSSSSRTHRDLPLVVLEDVDVGVAGLDDVTGGAHSELCIVV